MDYLVTGINVLLIIVGFGILIFVHELGHFVAAKWAGIRTDAFAIGMGPVVAAWRRGIGVTLGSTHQRVVARTGHAPGDLTDKQLAEHGIGETEYSLRWLPIGGFVRMLGQDDLNPDRISDDPRSYNRCPIGRRMVVVCAGVVANVVLAVVLFMIAFLAGVRFEAPIVGGVSATLPAGTTRADNAEALGLETVGLEAGDRVLFIGGKPARTFADLHIASAMSKPGVPIKLVVERDGVEEPLSFSLVAEHDPGSGLLSIGVRPGSSMTLLDKDEAGRLSRILEDSGLARQGVRGGMQMISAAGTGLSTHEQFARIVEASQGQPVATVWTELDERGEPVGGPVRALLDVQPRYQILRDADAAPEAVQNFEHGLLGLTPLVEITEVQEHSRNRDVLREGDVVLKVGVVEAPRWGQFLDQIKRNTSGTVSMLLLRDGREVTISAKVNRRGMINVVIGYAWDLPLTAQPLARIGAPAGAGGEAAARPSPVASLELHGRTRIESIGPTAVSDWPTIRRALRDHTAKALAAGEGAVVEVGVTHPTPGLPPETLAVSLSGADVKDLHELGWTTDLPSYVFEPIYTTLSADGNPLRAVMMGFEETQKFIVMTYLTIDRLIRGSVGVEQLRGPVGIIHIGTQIADRGLTYLIFFLALISVNLAVINFLPLPIVDGGLFLLLIYEKLKGRPPSLAFQNAATIVGMFLIGTVLLVTFYNDVMRLVSP